MDPQITSHHARVDSASAHRVFLSSKIPVMQQVLQKIRSARIWRRCVDAFTILMTVAIGTLHIRADVPYFMAAGGTSHISPDGR